MKSRVKRGNSIQKVRGLMFEERGYAVHVAVARGIGFTNDIHTVFDILATRRRAPTIFSQTTTSGHGHAQVRMRKIEAWVKDQVKSTGWLPYDPTNTLIEVAALAERKPKGESPCVFFRLWQLVYEEKRNRLKWESCAEEAVPEHLLQHLKS
jgi:hypothetical protein